MKPKKCVWIPMVVMLLLTVVACALVATRPRLEWGSPYQGLSSLSEGEILHLSTGLRVSESELIDMLSASSVIYVGEAHDNINAHKVQLRILKGLAERFPGKIAVGMEMLKRSSQEIADQWVSGELEEKAFVRTWIEDWSNDFEYYRDILRYLKDHKVPLLALRSPDDWVQRVKRDEFMDERAEGEDRLPEIDIEDPYHRAHAEAVFSKHPKHGQDFDDFYKVQVLWDESMAATSAEYLLSEEGRGKKMLVFAGNQHVEYGFGIPRRVFRRLRLPYAIVLPTAVRIPPGKKHKLMDVAMPEIPLLPADFMWIVSYEDLDDQRVYLGVMIRDTESGVKILGTMKTSVAARVGLEKDDIITAFDGETIKERFDLTYLISLKKPGESAVVEVLRGDETLAFEVTFESGRFRP